MLIIKPNLYFYAPNRMIESAKDKGIHKKNKVCQCFFTRIPNNISQYKELLKNYFLVRISISKLKRIKDQKVVLYAKNIPGYDNKQLLTVNNIKKLCQETDIVTKYLEKGYQLKDVPRCLLHLSDGFLPSWIYKIIESDDE